MTRLPCLAAALFAPIPVAIADEALQSSMKQVVACYESAAQAHGQASCQPPPAIRDAVYRLCDLEILAG